MARTVDNNGIGANYASFSISKTGENYDLTDSDLGKAVVLSADNTINLGSDGGSLIGRLEHVVGGLATVQISGVVRMDVNGSKTAPDVGNAVVVDGAGKVYQSPTLTDVPAGGDVARGTVLSVDTTNNIADVLL